LLFFFFFFQAEDGIRDDLVTGVQTCALPIYIPLFNDPLGVQALKTGFTQEAGYNLAVAAWRGGQEFVMIVLGSRSRAQSFLDARSEERRVGKGCRPRCAE